METLFKFHGPVCVVEELFPASVSLIAEVDVDERVVPGFDWFFYQLHAGMVWTLAALLYVAGRTGTDDVLPCGLAAHASRDDVVQRQLTGREMLAAVLAPVLVAGENVTAVEFDLGSRQAVVKQQPDNPGHRHIKINRPDPFVPVRLKIASELAHLAPAMEIVIRISALLQRDHFGKIPEQQRKRPLDPYYPYSHVMLVQYKNITVQTGMIFSSNHSLPYCLLHPSSYGLNGEVENPIF